MPPPDNGSAESVGVLLVNLGTPDAPTTPAVRRYLRQFLSDPRVVDFPRPLWWLALNLVILVIRPPRSAEAYRAIWTEQGSPLMVYSKALAAAMTERLGNGRKLELAMCYGKPSIASGISALRDQGVSRVIVLPMYPQFSFTTTAAVYDAVDAAFAESDEDLRVVRIEDYHDDAAYIAAHRDNILAFWEKQGTRNKLLMSFHGLPEDSVEKGDPYYAQCQATAEQLATALQLADDDWILCFQSRVGRQKWLQPYTEDVLAQLAADGVAEVDVVSPGFSVDCLETLEEIAIRYAEDFEAAGGTRLNYIPALNASPAHADLLVSLINRHMATLVQEVST